MVPLKIINFNHMKKIVVLDGYTLNPGDLSWDDIKMLGNLTVYDRTPDSKILERSEKAEILFTNKTPLGEDVFSKLPDLKYVGVLATGYNVVDIEAAKKYGIVVTNIPAYGTASVAQMTFALLLELCIHVQRHSDSVMKGKWSASADFCFWDYPLTELAGKTIGIIGFGTIGQKVGDIAAAFGMNVLAADKYHSDQSHRSNFKWTDIPELLSNSDVVTIHAPLTPGTEGLINMNNLKRMKRSAFLINTSRGPVVVDNDLADALNSGIIAGAGLDVLSVEPPPYDNPLFRAKNCLITPHIAWATKESRQRLMDIAVKNLEAFLNGETINQIGL
jgi:glycerate dehydrogenase